MADESTISYSSNDSVNSPLSSENFIEWGPVEIENWLIRQGFDHDLVSKFTSNNINGETLPFLKEEHYEELDLELKEKIRLKLEINKLLTSQNYLKYNDINDLKLVLTNINDLIQSNLNQVITSFNDEFGKLKEDLHKYSKPLPTPDKNPSSPFNLTSPTKAKTLISSANSNSGSNIANNSSPNDYLSHHHQTLQRKLSENKHPKSQRNSSLFQSSNISNHSPTATVTPSAQPQLQSHHSSNNIHSTSSSGSSTQVNSSSTTNINPNSSTTSLQTSNTSSKPVSEPLKQLRASTDDPCSKILQAAMKRHKLNDHDWRNYALVICYGDQERILELDEKPVQIFKELKEKGEHPAIMLRQRADFTIDVNKKISETPGGML